MENNEYEYFEVRCKYCRCIIYMYRDNPGAKWEPMDVADNQLTPHKCEYFERKKKAEARERSQWWLKNHPEAREAARMKHLARELEAEGARKAREAE